MPLESDEAMDWHELASIQLQLAQEGKPMDYMSEIDWAKVESMAVADASNEGASWARNILRELDNTDFPTLVPMLIDDPNWRMMMFDPTRQDFELSMFPNPTSDNLFLQWDSETERQFTLEIRDIQGKLVYQSAIMEVNGMENVDVKGWLSGTYVLEVKHEDLTLFTSKVQVVR